eukprot:1338510-Amorphochlora_amoeboformis.AAC.2
MARVSSEIMSPAWSPTMVAPRITSLPFLHKILTYLPTSTHRRLVRSTRRRKTCQKQKKELSDAHAETVIRRTRKKKSYRKHTQKKELSEAHADERVARSTQSRNT